MAIWSENLGGREPTCLLLECFVVVKTLTTAMLSLYNDPITHAKLDHIQAFNPPRLVYVTDLEYITSCKKAVTIHTTNLSEYIHHDSPHQLSTKIVTVSNHTQCTKMYC